MMATLLIMAWLPLGLAQLDGQETKKESPPAVKRQILAIGGGGGKAMMTYFLGLTGKKTPRVCFMPTATGDPKASIDKWYEQMKAYDCEPRHQKMFIASGQVKSFEDELLKADAIYVGGGNTLNMIAIWKAQGVDKILRKAWEKGTVLGGASAGSICWFEQGSTDSRPGELTPMDCLGFLSGSNAPHYDGEKKRRPLYQEWVKKGEIKEGIGADNGVALHYVDDKLFKVVTTRAKATAYRVTRVGDKAVEEPLKAELLPSN
jgi:peptidase E